ncbi:MAG: hypothetical protein HQL70_08375 [Magnetococcales bacterium]|nr:hypothetical protein [Magnetococcales bacterium]
MSSYAATVINLDDLCKADLSLLNQVADEIRESYIDLIATASKGLENNIYWQVSSVASRDPYMGRLYMRCCLLVLIKKIWLSGRNVERIVLSDKPLAKALGQLAEQHNITCTIEFKTIDSWWSRSKKRFIYQFATSIWHLLHRFVASMGKRQHYQIKEPITLLDMFVLGCDAPMLGMIFNGRYHDRYYPGLIDELNSQEKKAVYYLPSLTKSMKFSKIFPLLRSAEQQFMVIDDFLKPQDYFAALLYPFKTWQIAIPQTRFHKVDISPLIISEIRGYSGNYSSISGLLNYFFSRRLQEEGVSVRLLIEWYENQIIDRGMIAGFRKHCPETKITGYQGFITAAKLLIQIRPTNADRDARLIPDSIAVIGRNLLKPVKEFCQDFETVVAPAFRFTELRRARQFHPDPEHFTVLVGLPIGRAEVVTIINTILATTAEYTDSSVRYWIKPHPNFSVEQIKSMFDTAWPKSITFITGNISDFIEQADLFVSNASSTCVEALTFGVPVIIIITPNSISGNPIPKEIAKEMWRESIGIDDFIEAVKFYRSQDQETLLHNRKLGQKIINDYFEPVTRASVLHFLQL